MYDATYNPYLQSVVAFKHPILRAYLTAHYAHCHVEPAPTSYRVSFLNGVWHTNM